MSRPLPEGTSLLVVAPSKAWAHRIEVRDTGGAWIDLTRWWLSFAWTEDQDAGAVTGTLRFRREFRQADGTMLSLAPLWTVSPLNSVDGDYAPLLNPFARVRVSSAVYDPAENPPPPIADEEAYAAWSDALPWVEVFAGVIDDPSWGGKASVIELAVRDLAAPLQDAQITVERVYGDEDGVPIEDVLQALMEDNGFDDLTLAVLGDTEGWSLTTFKQARGVSVWDAMRTLALQMGWDLRYWRATDGSYAPTLRKPVRSTDVEDFGLTPDQFIDVPSLKLNGTDVRNDGELRYVDRATGEVTTVTYQDSGSVAAFGEVRSFGVEEGATSNIDTYDEALQMLVAMVTDLATPALEQDLVLSYLWSLQLGDVILFPGIPPLFDEAQRFGVSRIAHEITPTKARTTLGMRAKPVGAFTRWLELLRKKGGAATSGGPSPIIGPLLGEASGDGGGGDGICWLPITFERKTDSVEVFASTGLALPLDAPILVDVRRYVEVRRLEGETARADDWPTLVPIDTTPSYYRRCFVRSRGFDRREGLPETRVAQAADGFSATMGAITSCTVSRAGADNVLTWVAEASTSPHPLEILVWRDGSVIKRLPFATSGTWTDADLSTDRDYVYELQAFTTDGVASARSGPRYAVRRAPASPPDAPVFVDDTPITYEVRVGLLRFATAVIHAQCADPDAASIALQAYIGLWWVTLQTQPSPVPGETVVFKVGAQYGSIPYRLVAYTGGGVAGEISAPATGSVVEGLAP